MRDKNDMIREIEELLGSGGSREQAERMFEALREADKITFDARTGFEMAEIDEREWLAFAVDA